MYGSWTENVVLWRHFLDSFETYKTAILLYCFHTAGVLKFWLFCRFNFRRKSYRLTGVVGGLVTALGYLFSSFATQFHQLFISYGLVTGIEFISCLSVMVSKQVYSSSTVYKLWFSDRYTFHQLFISNSLVTCIEFISCFSAMVQ